MLEKTLDEAGVFSSSAEKVARECASLLGRLRKSLSVGDMVQVRRGLAELQRKRSVLESEYAQVLEALAFDESTYLDSSAYLDEVAAAADAAGIRTWRKDNSIQSFPISLTVQGRRSCILLGKRRETRLRPSVVAQELLQLRNAKSAMEERSFLEILYNAYRVLVPRDGGSQSLGGGVIPLMQVYSMLTLLPKTAKEYSIQDFAVDVYRLDQSRLQHTADGAVLSLPASTGTRNTSGALSVIAESGEEVWYYGVSFLPKEDAGGRIDATMA